MAKETITWKNLSSLVSFGTLYHFMDFEGEEKLSSVSVSSCYVDTAKSKIVMQHFCSVLFQRAEGSP